MSHLYCTLNTWNSSRVTLNAKFMQWLPKCCYMLHEYILISNATGRLNIPSHAIQFMIYASYNYVAQSLSLMLKMHIDFVFLSMSHIQYSGTPLNGHPWTKANCDITAMQAPRSQMNSLCTKQPLNKGHPYLTAKMLFPKGGRYRGVPL